LKADDKEITEKQNNQENQEKKVKILKGHWKRYNPFEPSEFINVSSSTSVSDHKSYSQADINLQKRKYGLG
jgi:multidrug resistance efflux pump